MKLIYSIHASAKREIRKAALFLNSHDDKLGKALIDEYEQALAQILQYPESGTCFLQYRQMQLKRFPYSLFYSIRSDQIRFLAFAHHKRNPLYWLGRR